MVEPVTTNKTLIVPNTGDLTGAWGTSALNPNFQTIDAMFGGVTTISLSAATTLLLTVPATTGVWPGSLSQSVNALIRFTGAQSGNATIQFTLPGFYIIENLCTGSGSQYVRLQPANLTGNCIGAIPNKKQKVFYDGTHMDYVDMPDPGTAYDLHWPQYTVPAWMTACTVAPYLVKDGSVYSASVYPGLFAVLGGTFGGNGVTTFAVPDERARFRMGVDPGSTGRVTGAGSGINGAAFNATGGSQLMQSHTHVATDSGHTHVLPSNTVYNTSGAIVSGGAGAPLNPVAGTITAAGTASISVTSTGGGSSQNMPPMIVSFLPLIKT